MKLTLKSRKIQQVFTDTKMVEELAGLVKKGYEIPFAKEWNVNTSMIGKLLDESIESVSEVAADRPFSEAVILRFMRPSLLIQNNQFQVPFSDELATRLLNSKYTLEKRIPSVGRIELVNHPSLRWGGTGWVIAEDTIVTNRHVAQLFADVNQGGEFIFRSDMMGNTIGSNIDFYEEHINNQEFELRIEKIEFIETDSLLPDFALLKIKKSNANPPPIPISKINPRDHQNLVVIGYPAKDPRGIPDEEVARRVFGDIYDVKRLSPGQVKIIDNQNWYFTHDATTLGGNSGSVVLDMETGHAIGLHYAGRLQQANYAVKASELLKYLVKGNIPVTVPKEYKPDQSNFTTDLIDEGRASDYKRRKGFNRKFLGTRNVINLPSINNASDIYKYKVGNEKKSELTYTNFSVLMSKERRMCFYSAVNIDGEKQKRHKRKGWRYDPRLPKEFQIKKECYGNFPKYSRGHMTRRMDPSWGRSAKKGNDDSMHVTNAVPQIQPFNAGIWLGLEDYALENAEQDNMKISVITGPFFKESDDVKWGVRIPTEFWKIICFIHDETGELTVTGYTMNQEDYLPNEFVFGAYSTYQTPVSVIERLAGLDFGGLSDLDPIDDFTESIPMPLTELSQIKFKK